MVELHHPSLSVRAQCHLLPISRSSFIRSRKMVHFNAIETDQQARRVA